MAADSARGAWLLVRENRKAVLERLEKGEVDDLIPASSGFVDAFCAFLERSGLLVPLEDLPDGRKDPLLVPMLFVMVLLFKALWRIDSLRQTPSVLFQCPDVLRKMGFSARLVDEGAYPNSATTPFTMEAMANYLASLDPEALVERQFRLVDRLYECCPRLFASQTVHLDCWDISLPRGKRDLAAQAWELCVCSLRVGDVALPLVWSFQPHNASADVVQGKALLDRILAQVPAWPIRRVIIDRGFLDGQWITDLKARGVDTIIGLRSDMLAYQDAIAFAPHLGKRWQPAAPPDYRDRPAPTRHIARVPASELWETCQTPLAVCLIEDRHDDGAVVHQVVVSSNPRHSAARIHELQRSRWAIEELFMDLTRYWPIHDLKPARPGVAQAEIHFILLAYALLRLFCWIDPAHALDRPIPRLVSGTELTVYSGEWYAILNAAELVLIVLDHHDAWRANRERVLQIALRARAP
jgi:hypothetical protein